MLIFHLRNQKPVLAWLYFSISRFFRINFGVHISLAVCLRDCKIQHSVISDFTLNYIELSKLQGSSGCGFVCGFIFLVVCFCFFGFFIIQIYVVLLDGNISISA